MHETVDKNFGSVAPPSLTDTNLILTQPCDLQQEKSGSVTSFNSALIFKSAINSSMLGGPGGPSGDN